MVLDDVRRAAGLLGRQPGFAAVAIGTIALAIGANTAMFSFVHGLLLSPLPYPDSDRIVRVLERLPGGATNAISTLDYLDWASQNGVFDHMAAEAGWQATLTGGGEPISIRGARASARYFDIFGTRAALGRTFLPDEDTPGSDRVVLLTHGLWQSRFGGDPAILGRAITLNGEPYTVVGVLEQDGPFERAAARIWTPLVFQPSNMTRDFRWLSASARLKPDVTLEQARAEMNGIAARLAGAYPDSHEGRGAAVDRLADVLVSPGLRAAVTVLFAGTVFVLLIGCANLANLALARGLSRERELSVRAALGGTRWFLIRQVLIENVLLGLCGGVVGLGVGYAMLQGIQWVMPPYAMPPAVDIRLNGVVLIFTSAVAVATGLLFGIAPAAQAAKANLAGVLRLGGQAATTGVRGRRMRHVLVAGEIALAFVLLAASGLLMRSFLELLDLDPGFEAANALTAGLPITPEQHPDAVELNGYLASVRAAVDAVPGVRGTALASAPPLMGWGYGTPYAIAGREPADRADRRRAFFKIVSPSYFTVLDISLLAGRVLTDDDTRGAAPVAVINEALARREFPDEDPIGRRLLVPELVPGGTALGRDVAWEVVGVVAGERITGLGDPISSGMYVSNDQSPTYGVHLIVRTGVPPESLQPAIRTAVASVDPDQALADIRTLEQVVYQSALGNRVMSQLSIVFAGLALLLAVLGLYGVMAHTVVERRQEMGIRAALGASTGRLRLRIFLGGMRLTALGLAAGLVVAIFVTPLISFMLYGIGEHDRVTFAVVTVVLAGVSGLACLVPAWRMTTIDPLEALRAE